MLPKFGLDEPVGPLTEFYILAATRVIVFCYPISTIA